MAVTIYNIAEKLGVNSATVSRALNNHPRISKATRTLVTKTAKEMGYRVNFAGKFLKTGKTNTIGLVLPDLSNPYYIDFLRNVEVNCMKRGYKLVTTENMKDVSKERSCLEQMLERHCDGFIAIINMVSPLRDIFDELHSNKLPCVIASMPPDVGDTHIDGTIIDISFAMEEAVEHLINFGHKEITFVESLRPNFSDVNRIAGIKRAFDKHGINFDGEKNILSIYTGDYVKDGYIAAELILKEKKNATAIIAFNDLIAAGIFKALYNNGCKVPDDFSIISVDNTWLSRTLPVSLTSIDQKVEEDAKIVTDILFKRLKQKEWKKVIRKKLFPALVVRESTGPVRKL